jgi:hypothetical protein
MDLVDDFGPRTYDCDGKPGNAERARHLESVLSDSSGLRWELQRDQNDVNHPTSLAAISGSYAMSSRRLFI